MPDTPTPRKPPSFPPEAGSVADEVVKTFRHVATIPGGAMASWRVIFLGFLTIFGGGVGYTGWRFITVEQAEAMIVEHEEKRTVAQIALKTEVTKNTGAISGLKATIGSVQRVQHQDIAHREARRVVGEEIKCRRNDNGCEDRLVDERERIRQLNMVRLEKGKTPCAKLQCTAGR